MTNRMANTNKHDQASVQEGPASGPSLSSSQLPSRYGRPDPETNSGIPLEMPFGACRPTPLEELIARMVRQEVMSRTNSEPETFEESNDFEDDDDPDLLDISPYELTEVTEEYEMTPQTVSEAASETNEADPKATPRPESSGPSEAAG